MENDSKDRSVVLLSAGLDSTVNLYQALKETSVIAAITFSYGQRAVQKEINQAKKICQDLKLNHVVVSLPWFSEFSSTSLVNHSMAIPKGKEVNIDSISISQLTANRVWVPNRNGIFLNIAAGFAEGWGAKWVIPGWNAEEAMTFADNSIDFLQRLNQSFFYSTQNRVQVLCYTIDLSKKEIVKKGKLLKVPFGDLWPCYLGEENWCGTCESCLRFQRAMNESL